MNYHFYAPHFVGIVPPSLEIVSLAAVAVETIQQQEATVSVSSLPSVTVVVD